MFVYALSKGANDDKCALLTRTVHTLTKLGSGMFDYA